MADFPVTRIGTILAVASVPASVAWYTTHLGFSVDALPSDPGRTAAGAAGRVLL